MKYRIVNAAHTPQLTLTMDNIPFEGASVRHDPAMKTQGMPQKTEYEYPGETTFSIESAKVANEVP